MPINYKEKQDSGEDELCFSLVKDHNYTKEPYDYYARDGQYVLLFSMGKCFFNSLKRLSKTSYIFFKTSFASEYASSVPFDFQLF